jgi:hypothetical protein
MIQSNFFRTPRLHCKQILYITINQVTKKRRAVKLMINDDDIEKEKDRRRTARKLLTEFLISINNNQELLIQDRYAVLRSRNPKNYPVLEDLMGLSENETNEFLKLVGIVRGIEAYTMVHEPILNEIAMDCKLGIGLIYFKLKTRQAPVSFILFGTHPKAHCPNNSEEQKFSQISSKAKLESYWLKLPMTKEI